MTKLQLIKEAMSEARSKAERVAKRDCVVVRSRGSDFVSLDRRDDDVERLCEGEFQPKLSWLKELVADERAVTFYIGGGFDGADSVRDMLDGEYEPCVSDWSIEIDRELNVISND